MGQDRADIHTIGIPVLCQSCEARHRGLCGVLGENELREFARHTRKAVHQPGRELSGESLPVTTYANVMHGVVKLTKTMEDGRQQIVGLQFAPDFLGRIFGRTHEVRAEAASEVELCVLPAGALEAMVEATPALEHRLMQQTLRELDDARAWMLTLGRKTAEEKLASFLVLIATHTVPGEETTRFALPLSRSDIADFLGLTIETVSRQLTRLKARGLIALEGRRGVTIEDIGALRALASTSQQ